jgi:hypothetical protein
MGRVLVALSTTPENPATTSTQRPLYWSYLILGSNQKGGRNASGSWPAKKSENSVVSSVFPSRLSTRMEELATCTNHRPVTAMFGSGGIQPVSGMPSTVFPKTGASGAGPPGAGAALGVKPREPPLRRVMRSPHCASMVDGRRRLNSTPAYGEGT